MVASKTLAAIGTALALALAAGAASPGRAAAQAGAPLPVAALAGQRVALLPLGGLGADPGLDSLIRDPRATRRWADSLIAQAFDEGAAEVDWVGPGALRRLYRQAPGFMPDPDRLGHEILAAKGLAQVPDPLRADLRKLAGLAGGRHVLAPAALVFTADSVFPVGVRLGLVVADTRTGAVLWRTVASAAGRGRTAALVAALAQVFPPE